jgi:hypothetical protein
VVVDTIGSKEEIIDAQTPDDVMHCARSADDAFPSMWQMMHCARAPHMRSIEIAL